MEEDGTDWLSLLIHKGKAENEKLDKYSVALQGKILEQEIFWSRDGPWGIHLTCEKSATTQHLEVTLASGTYNEVKPSMSFPGLSRQVVIVVKSWSNRGLFWLQRQGLDTEYVVHEQTMKAQIQVG